MNRYRVARAKEDTELLHAYGLKLLSVESGLTAALEAEVRGERIHPWNLIEVNEKTWKWLRPLLLRLREAEEAAATMEDVQQALRLAAK
jgi:hypothetical protein